MSAGCHQQPIEPSGTWEPVSIRDYHPREPRPRRAGPGFGSCSRKIVVVAADQVLLWTATSVGRQLAMSLPVLGAIAEGPQGRSGVVLSHAEGSAPGPPPPEGSWC